MSLFDALLLGIIQGLTEFFPVSSSTHLKITQKLLGIEGSHSLLLFDLICHLGTLLAALFFFRKDIQEAFKSREKLLLLFLALIPLVPCYFLFRPLRQSGVHFQGITLLITALFLFFAYRSKARVEQVRVESKFKDVLFIGAMQGMALIPGISRSGSTIAAACFRGWEVKEAVRFSFLLAIPTVMGGSLLEGYKLLSHKGVQEISLALLAIGFLTSFLVGLLGVKMMCHILDKKRLLPFAGYCFLLGIFSLWYLW